MSEVASLDPNTERQRWVEIVRGFCDEVAGWSEGQGWDVSREELDLTEELLGTYTVPKLVIRAEQAPSW